MARKRAGSLEGNAKHMPDWIIVWLAQIQGGVMRFTHCGRMILQSVCARVNARLSADSHWLVGIELIEPRTISAMLAITGSESPNVAFSQAGSGLSSASVAL